MKNHYNNIVVAHRGAWKKAGLPQNSIEALEAAIALGCAGSETDVHLTADGILVINHDPVWSGLKIIENTLEELQKAKLPKGKELPLLTDFLKIIKEHSAMRLFLEIKSSKKIKKEMKTITEKVVNVVNQMQVQQWIIYISFEYEILKEILRLDSFANVQYLNGDKTPLQLKKNGIKGADYHYSVFHNNDEWIQSAKDNNIDLNAWTVNEQKVMNWLLEKGFNFITTDEPELLLREIEKSFISGKKSN